MRLLLLFLLLFFLLLLLLQCLPYRYTAVCVLVCLQQVHLSRLRPFSPHPRSYVATSLRAIMHQLNYSTDPWTLERPASCALGLLLDQCSKSSGLMIIRDYIYWPINRDYHHAFGEFLSSKLNTAVVDACFLRDVRQWPADQQIITWGFDKTMQRQQFVVRIWFWPSPARQLHQTAVLVSSCLNIFLNQMVIRSQHTGIDMGVSCVGYMCSADG